MSRNRMEAFSDGVLAIIITIMVLKLKTPQQANLSEYREIFPTLLAYLLSYLYIGIYWVNHHHLVSMIHFVTGAVLWKNLHWLFWMSLIPAATEWMGLNALEKIPAAVYGLILFMCSVSYHMLQRQGIKLNGKNSKLAKQIGKDIKGKVSMTAYAVAILLSLLLPLAAYIIYLGVAVAWIVPDSRIAKITKEQEIQNASKEI